MAKHPHYVMGPGYILVDPHSSFWLKFHWTGGYPPPLQIYPASDVLGIVECPLPDATNYTAPAAKKRRRKLEERVEKSLTNDMQTTVLKSLRDPSNQRESHLSAPEHKLLCTIIPESALLPDIAAMHDLYHPNVCLYDTTQDRLWNSPMAVHLGFASTTMLHEFALHR